MKLTCPHCHKTIVLPENEESRLMLQLRDDLFYESVDQAVAERMLLKQKEYDAQTLQAASEHERLLAEQREHYESKLQEQKAMLEYYKDLKLQASTKMVGETLEQHCMTEFNRIRMTAFPHAYFEKDNDASGGSKGDFIYRELDEDGDEILSIMFEMKNEMDTTKTKHKNEHFFAKLDKDRTAKSCEYAVLVSLLESDSEFYNTGIVDVSYRYEKMYVIRPQFFITLITLLRNAALRSSSYRKELKTLRQQCVDAVSLEHQIHEFQTEFHDQYDVANDRIDTAIMDIDKSISKLEQIRKNLLSASKHLNKVGCKVDDFEIFSTKND